MSQTAEPRKWDFTTGALPYRDQLFKSALRMTRSVEDAEDLLQRLHVAVRVTVPLCLAKANAVNDGGVIQCVRYDGVFRPEQGFKQSAVGIEA